MSAAVSALPGVSTVAYDAHEDWFVVSFDAAKTSIEAIFAAVYAAGRQEGREYLPHVAP